MTPDLHRCGLAAVPQDLIGVIAGRDDARPAAKRVRGGDGRQQEQGRNHCANHLRRHRGKHLHEGRSSVAARIERTLNPFERQSRQPIMPAPADLHGVSSLSPSSPFSGAGGPFAARLKWLRDGGRAALVRQGLRGVEKESLRVGEDGRLSRSAASDRARRGADSPVHHDRLFRSVARARDAAAADPMGDAAVPLRRARVHPAALRRRAACGRPACRASCRPTMRFRSRTTALRTSAA